MYRKISFGLTYPSEKSLSSEESVVSLMRLLKVETDYPYEFNLHSKTMDEQSLVLSVEDLLFLRLVNCRDNRSFNDRSRTKFKNKIPFGYLKIKFSPRLYFAIDLFCQLSLPSLSQSLYLLRSYLTCQFKVDWNLDKHNVARFSLFRARQENQHSSLTGGETNPG